MIYILYIKEKAGSKASRFFKPKEIFVSFKFERT